MAYSITNETAPSETYDTFFRTYFQEYSLKKLGKDANWQSWRFVARDDESIVGIIQGDMMWDVLHIELLMVKPEYRKLGVGGLLVSKVVDLAKEHCCAMMTVETFDFQAPEYWQAKGFKIDLKRGGYDGNTLYYLSKLL
jgi:ribosomal protein S18 acetylase RimI-like enzyme